ncbi:MAG: hypothetical protein HY820_31430 [Acidobacteria bacterium]|nr:hypothetical protein [Acidobacteriota bacterium]
MSFGFWFRPPRILLASFLAVTVLPACALFWLSWRFFDQDRALASQRSRERREQAADLIVVALQQSLAKAELDLRLPGGDGPQDALAVIFDRERVRTSPKLLYYPVVRATQASGSSVFENGERFEFQQQDYESAIAAFRNLAKSADATVRAGAHLRIARNLRKAGKPDLALAEYDTLVECGAVALDGLPADLVARRARLNLLRQLGREAESHAEMQAVLADLQTGRWELPRAAFLFQAQQLGFEPPRQSVAFAQAVEWLWNKRTQAAFGREQREFEGFALTLLWRGERALVADQRFVERQWLAPLEPLLRSQSVRLALSLPGTGTQMPPAPETIRASSVTGLPWPLLVASADPASDLREYTVRRRFLVSVLALLAAVVCAGSYLIARAVNRELAAARLQSDFVSAVSHEFRTPLTLLRQITEGFAEGRVADEGQRHAFYQAQMRATERLHRLVESLLDFGRMEAGAKPYRLHPIDPGGLVSGVVRDFEKEVAAGGYAFELRIPETVPAVNGDPDALTHALWNLLDNAVKYSPDHRTVWVDVGRQGEQVAIAVRDQGLGIPEDEQQRIFGKFVRGAASRVNAIKGTGIGLAMVRHIVLAHGGDIHLQSAPGTGSTFTILLPAMKL